MAVIPAKELTKEKIKRLTEAKADGGTRCYQLMLLVPTSQTGDGQVSKEVDAALREANEGNDVRIRILTPRDLFRLQSLVIADPTKKLTVFMSYYNDADLLIQRVSQSMSINSSSSYVTKLVQIIETLDDAFYTPDGEETKMSFKGNFKVEMHTQTSSGIHGVDISLPLDNKIRYYVATSEAALSKIKASLKYSDFSGDVGVICLKGVKSPKTGFKSVLTADDIDVISGSLSDGNRGPAFKLAKHILTDLEIIDKKGDVNIAKPGASITVEAVRIGKNVKFRAFCTETKYLFVTSEINHQRWSPGAVELGGYRGEVIYTGHEFAKDLKLGPNAKLVR